MPLVSIIVPIYNATEYLENCIHSLLDQDYSTLEVIAVNDGSTDNSLYILNELSKKDARLVVVNQKNQGVSAARNHGLSIAKGEYVMFTDADDWLDGTALSVCVHSILSNKADVCMFAYMREYENRSNPRYLFPEDKIFNEVECAKLQRRLIGPVGNELRNPGMLDSLGTIWGKLYHRSVVEKMHFVDLKEIGTAEDTLFNIVAFLKVHKAVYVNRPFYHYRKNNSASETKRYKADLYLKWNCLFAYMKEAVHSKEAQTALSNRIALSMMGLGLNECASRNAWKEQKKRIRCILEQPHYVEAYRKLDFSYFPLHWKLFYFSAKHRLYYLYLFLVSCMNRAIS